MSSNSGARSSQNVRCVPLLVLSGTFNDLPTRILKDDGCTSNVISREFAEAHRDEFEFRPILMDVCHSKAGSGEIATEMVLNGTIRIGHHSYTADWIVADARYDVLLGMPWHIDCNPRTDYPARTVFVDSRELSAEYVPRLDARKVQPMGAKQFRRALRRPRSRMQFFRVAQVSSSEFAASDVVQQDHKAELLDADDSELRSILCEYEGVFQDELPLGLPPSRDVDHAIELLPDTKPPHRAPYQLSPAELVAAREYVEKLLQSGKIRPSRSPYGAPLFFVKEPGRDLRGVVDYRALNRITKRNNAPLPRCDEMFDRLGQARFFSKLDLKTGFHQIRLRPSDIEKTAFNTNYGQFEYMVMPMGLCNAPASFQSLMNGVLHDYIDRFLVVYIDDILIYSRTREEHLQHIRCVLERLRKHKSYVSPKRCSFMASETEFLGLRVSREGLSVHPGKVEVIKNWPRPLNVTELRSFLGLVQFFRRFIPQFSLRAAPLTSLTQKGSSIKDWNSKCQETFSELKEALISAPVLVPPDWSRPFHLHIDASQLAIGATLTQFDDDGHDRVIAYTSRKLTSAERNNTANERELLALVFSLQRFRCYLEGSTFDAFTDNQVVENFMTKKSLNRREARWLDVLATFNIRKVNLVQGKLHVLGDSLSRIPDRPILQQIQCVTPSFSELEGVLARYDKDQFFGSVVAALDGEWPTDPKHRKRLEVMLPSFAKDDWRLLYKGKLCVPSHCRRQVLEMAHDSKVGGHFAFTKTLARLAEFHWKHKAKEVKRYCDGCSICQQQKDYQGPALNDPTPLPVPTRRWGMLATDFIVKLPRTQHGFDAIATWVDRLSRRVRFVACKETDSAPEVAKAFFTHIFPHHGLPDSIISDRDPRFISSFWQSLMDLCGVKTRMSSARHPQTDGASEVMNRMVENYIRCFCSFEQTDWDVLLPSAEFAYNSAVSEDIGLSPFEVNLGWKPKAPLDTLFQSIVPLEALSDFRDRLQAVADDAMYAHQLAKARQTAEASVHFKKPTYQVGDQVWVSRKLFRDSYAKAQESSKLSARRFGPFRILELVGKNAVRLDFPSNIRTYPVVHVSHTKPNRAQPTDIGQPTRSTPLPVEESSAGSLYKVDRILAHRKRGRGYQWLTLLETSNTHDAQWQPTRDFVNVDGTLTKAFREYIVDNNLLAHLH